MILTGNNTRNILGEELQDLLIRKNNDVELLLVASSDINEVDRYVDLVNDYNPEFLICAGGGKTIDVGKYITTKSSNRNLEMIALPTIPSHDGLASPYIFLNDPGETLIGNSKPPIAVIADINKMMQHPDILRYIAAGVGDSIGKFTSIWDWRLASKNKSEKFSRFVGGVLENSDTLLQHQINADIPKKNLYDAIQVAIKAQLISGVLMGTYDNIRVGYGSEHLFSSALDALIPDANILHGERIALGTIMMASLQGQEIKPIKDILEYAGCPTSIYDLEEDLNPNILIQALLNAQKFSNMYTIFDITDMTEESAWELAISSYVIDE